VFSQPALETTIARLGGASVAAAAITSTDEAATGEEGGEDE
jgi:hypothetical protein